MEHLYSLKKNHKNKVYFIHLNHSNPAIKEGDATLNIIKSKGFNVAREGLVFPL
jgi:pyrroloquinoline quinone biosynthesis protein B